VGVASRGCRGADRGTRAGQAASLAANGRLASVNERLRRVVDDAAARHQAELGAVRAERDRPRSFTGLAGLRCVTVNRVF